MAKIDLNVAQKTVPMIYAYTTPEIKRHNGWTKIGYTEQDVDKRINQQTHTSDTIWHKEWQGLAAYDDGTGRSFKDTDFHAYLRKKNYKQDNDKNNEWFEISGVESKSEFYDFRSSGGILEQGSESAIKYTLRDEQSEAVTKALNYFNAHKGGAFLWNAKPRFGKTLAAYELCKKLNAEKILIVTNRPAIANSWYDDYVRFLGLGSGYLFVSDASQIKGKSFVISRSDYESKVAHLDEGEFGGCIEFVSLQDLKGSKYLGGEFDKLREVTELWWDLLIIDEAHEGADTYKADVAFDHIKRKATLHLSGTPFKILASDTFPEEAIYNWTYADEQKRKSEYVPQKGSDNPYAKLPQLNMYTYKMSDIVKEKVQEGSKIGDENVDYAFDLNEFFETDEEGRFVHNEDINRFLNALTTNEKFPFSTDELRSELKHTVWLLNRVDSAKALVRKLKNHDIFKNYEIILAAGDGKLDDDETFDKEAKNAYDRVTKAIKEHDKTITLTVGQLTTGITIPEWTAILMLSSIQSPALYMQAAFRTQNPCLFSNGKEFFRKRNSYIFDFDPARTLILFEKFANDLSEDTANGKGDTDTRKKHVKELLNFFPVLGEDEDGEMILLDENKVLSIPRRIKSKEVVRRGFISNFLFQNISNVFAAGQAVMDIINSMQVSKEDPKKTSTEEVSLEGYNDEEISNELVIGLSKEIFGEKIYETVTTSTRDIIHDIKPEGWEDKGGEFDELAKNLTSSFNENVTKAVLDTASQRYGEEMRSPVKNSLEKRISADASKQINKVISNLKIEQSTLEADKEKELDSATTKEETNEIKERYEIKHKEAIENFKRSMDKSLEDMAKQAEATVVKTVETDKKETKKKGIEDSIRNHLRGFAMTIPSFLMAYGSDEKEINLASFDSIVPADVFKDVTSITIDEFCFLRDGGDYKDPETGESRHFDGHLFDRVVFDDSIKEFLALKKSLANYFDEKNKEDIFDYIPPQKTNQIFTPKKVVCDMVSMLEKENPSCFDNPESTFADLYMKSGMYIAEIVKRLYQSPKIKELYPDNNERLNHIFAKQVYACAPTEIIYRIALAYILGFADDIEIKKYNIKLCDTLECAKEGTLDKKLEELFPELKKAGE